MLNIMKTQQQALDEAGEVLADVLAIVSSLTPREAAERAWHPGGPSLDELEQRISETGVCRGGLSDVDARPSHRGAASHTNS